MHCVVTAGPTYESLDNVRRLTNFSTGKLGAELARFLTERGHDVTLLIGEQATYGGERRAKKIEVFSSTADLQKRLQSISHHSPGAVFHAAAVSDYSFGRTWLRSATGEMTEIKSGKISTRDGVLMAELVPTPKIIAGLREWFPQARIIGWKFEVEGNQESVLTLARRQIAECHTDACVANGKAYGPGFGIVTSDAHQPLADATALFTALEKLVTTT